MQTGVVFVAPVVRYVDSLGDFVGSCRVAAKGQCVVHGGRLQTRGHEYWKDFGREVAHDCPETLRCTEGLIVGSVYRRGKPNDLAHTKKELYADLVARFESELDASDSLDLIFMDGDGSDSSYRSTHRGLALAQRRVIEDAIHLDSSGPQLVQMADLVAWSDTAMIDQHPKNEFAAQWYSDYLAERDPRRAPREL